MTDVDYDRHYPKHCARYYGWLPASKACRGQARKKHLKYFTLCARQAIDVFMLELEGVLQRDDDGRLPDVVICEKDGRDAADIFKLVRPPLKEAILVGRLEDILLFEETSETRGRSPEEDVRDYRLRRLLSNKRLLERMKTYAPFDIINFDPYGNFLNPDLDENRLYQSFVRMLEIQENAEEFLLFLTTPIFDIHPDTQSRLKGDLESNASKYPEIRRALLSSVGLTAYDGMDENKRVALGVAKSVVISAARSKGWKCEHLGIYVYHRQAHTKLLSSVVQFSKARSPTDESVYVDDIVRVVRRMPKYYPYRDSLRNKTVKAHLDRVVRYRDRIRREYAEEA